MNHLNNYFAVACRHRGWLRSFLLVSVFTCCCFDLESRGQLPSQISSTTQSSASQTDLEVEGQASQADSGKEVTEQSRHGSFVGAPIPSSSPAIGTGVTLMAGYIFPISKS